METQQETQRQSRVGKAPIPVPKGVEVTIDADGRNLTRLTDDAFGDSMAKAEAAREQVKIRTADSDSTQKRILNE